MYRYFLEQSQSVSNSMKKKSLDFFGLVGAGRTDTKLSLVLTRLSGEIYVEGGKVKISSQRCDQAGIGLVQRIEDLVDPWNEY